MHDYKEIKVPAQSDAQPVSLEQSNPYIDVLNDIFNLARTKDEFDYVCALLRIRGLQDPGWDELEESFGLFKDLTSLVQAPLEPITKIRLLLGLYTHMTGTDSVYWTLMNMLLIAQGNGCEPSPFQRLYDIGGFKSSPSPASMINLIGEQARALDRNAFADLIGEMYNEDVRRAFIHSDYRLAEDEFATREGAFPEDMIYSSTDKKFVQRKSEPITLKLGDLVNLINTGLSFFQAFNYVRVSHTRSYTSEKQLQTRLGQTVLLVHPDVGLFGFEVRN